MKIIKRNLFNKDFRGRFQPEITISDTENSYHLTNYEKLFYVSKNRNGLWEILKRDTWAVYDAMVGTFPFCEKTPKFESMIQAVYYMILNAEELS